MKRGSLFGITGATLLAGVAAFLIVFAPVTAREAPAAPALWKIDGANGDVYLFGSIHILPKGFAWRRPELEAALKEAQRLVFEIDIDQAKNMGTMSALLAKYGFLPSDKSLHKMLAPEHRKKLDAVATSLGMPPAALDRMRPWLAAVTLTSLSLLKQNAGGAADPKAAMDEAAGVDQQLWTWAKSAGKERAALETAEDQIRIFADLPLDQEVEFLIVSLSEVEKAPGAIDTLLDAWKAGDTKKLDRALNADMAAFPALRKAVFDDRHAKWLPQIEAMLHDGRTHVIVVGAAHLVGDRSVVAMLRAKGTRVQGP
jgi:uncharacterized protein YbaP (TraB family)